MANKKISELDVRSSLSLSDLMVVGDPSTGYAYKTTLSDLKTITGAGVISFNGRFGAVVPTEGDYALTQLSDVIITSPTANQVLKYNGTTWVNDTVTENDTLQSVTDRGATTTNALTVGNNANAVQLTVIGAIQAAGVFTTDSLSFTGTNKYIYANGLVFNTNNSLGNSTRTTFEFTQQVPSANSGTGVVDLVKLNMPVNTGTLVSDSRALVIDFNVTTNAGTLTAIDAVTGKIRLRDLSGTGSRMVVADANGVLGVQAIPTSAVSSVFGRTGAVVAASGDYTTAQVTESGNLYYTDARARASISAGTGISYSSSTGVISSTITQYTDANARAALSFAAGSGAYNSSTGVITIPTNNSQLVNGAGYITSSALTSYVPYSGATNNLNLGIYDLRSRGVVIEGNSGTGFQQGLAIKQYNGYTFANAGYTQIVPLNSTDLDIIHIQSNNAKRTISLSSAILNDGDSFQYLFPRASGTLALTSQIPTVAGVYLPLSGGTLTGALAGTSATFSGNVSASGQLRLEQSAFGSIVVGSRSGQTDFQIYNTANILRIFNGSADALTISTTGAATFSSSVTAGNALITTGAVTSNQTGGQFGYSGSSVSLLGAWGANTSTRGILSFYLSNSSGSTGNEYARLTDSLFSVVPAATFSSSITAGGNVLVPAGSGLAWSGDASRIMTPEDNVSGALIQTPGIIRFRTGGNEAMRINASGNVGIGVTPSAANLPTLEMQYGLFNGTSEVNIMQNVVYNSGFKYLASNSATRYYQGGGSHQWFTAASGTAGNTISFTQAMTLNASGNLALGTPSPTNINNYISQTINGFSGSFTEYRQNEANTFRVGSDISDGGFLFTQGTTAVRFGTASTERMRITSGGNVGIGTASPGARLEVAQSDAVNDIGIAIRQQANFTASFLRLTANNDGGAGYNYIISDTNGGTEHWKIWGGNAVSTLAFNTGGTERMRITSGGAVELTGTIKTAAPSGGTAKPWKLGQVFNTTYTPTKSIVVEIDGLTYYISAIGSWEP